MRQTDNRVTHIGIEVRAAEEGDPTRLWASVSYCGRMGETLDTKEVQVRGAVGFATWLTQSYIVIRASLLSTSTWRYNKLS